MTARERLNSLIIGYVTRTKKPAEKVWNALYSRFEYQKNINYRKLAYINSVIPLDTIEELGHMEELLAFAIDILGEKPPLAEKKKAPLQGSLL